MTTVNRKSFEYTVGMDISDKTLHLCILDSLGDIVNEVAIPNEIGKVEEVCQIWPEPSKVQIAMETGTHSPWLSDLFKKRGYHVLVGNPRKLRAIWDSDQKTDLRDARMLARIARFDPRLLYPIEHRSVTAHKDLAVIKSRDLIVGVRSKLVSSVRGQLKAFGVKPPTCDAGSFPKKIKECIPEGLELAVYPLLDTMVDLNKRIKRLEKEIESLCRNKYPDAKLLQQVNGVGPITALAFVLTLESPHRLHSSRDVGPFLGLVPKKDSSGDVDKELSITKAGNKYLRRLLVGSAQYILGPFGKDCDLKRFGERIIERSPTKSNKRKAVVATARKLAVLLHSIWLNRSEYTSFRNSSKTILAEAT